MLATAQRWLRKGRSWAWRRLRRGRVPHAVVLMYHRIAAPPRFDPWRLSVSPERFEAQLRALRSFADIVPLDDLPRAMRKRRDGRAALAITFDDGYLDNLVVAKPMLDRYGAPATVFLATTCIERGGRYWWDHLVDIVYGPGILPEELRVEGPQGLLEWRGARSGADASSRVRTRQALLDLLWSTLVRLNDDARRALLASLDQWAGNPRPVDPAAMPMAPDQVSELVAGGLIRVGAHTATHAWLPTLGHEQALAELRQSRHDCGRLAGIEPGCFAYPFGAYDQRTVEWVRAAGFELAVTSDGGLAWADRDPLALPRIAVGDWSGQRLARYLQHYWLA